jgi:hypothetical protein
MFQPHLPILFKLIFPLGAQLRWAKAGLGHVLGRHALSQSGKALSQSEGTCAKPKPKRGGQEKLSWFGARLSGVVLSQRE